MEKLKEYFKPIQKGNWKGFTFWGYYKKNVLVPSIVSFLMIVVTSIILLSGDLDNDSKNGMIFKLVMGISIFIISNLGIISTWGLFRKRNEK